VVGSNEAVQVTEESILRAMELWRSSYDSEPPNLAEALSKGKVFKDEGLHPFYIMRGDEVIVTSTEAMDGKLN
jgi:hypothetical protein